MALTILIPKRSDLVKPYFYERFPPYYEHMVTFSWDEVDLDYIENPEQHDNRCGCYTCDRASSIFEKLAILEEDQYYDEDENCDMGDGACILSAFETSKCGFLDTIASIRCTNCLRTIFPSVFRPDPQDTDSDFVKRLRLLRSKIGVKEFSDTDIDKMMASPFIKHKYLCTCAWCIKSPFESVSQETYKKAKGLCIMYFS